MYRRSYIARRDDKLKLAQRRAEAASFQAKRRTRRRGTIPMSISLEAIRKQLQHNQAMASRYLTENPVRMAENIEAHARTAARTWITLHAMAIDGQRDAQDAIQTLCGEFGVESILDLEHHRIQL